MRLFGLAIEANRPEIRFVLLTNALEGLLMTRGDGDSIRTRMAEKVSFLLEAEGIRRQDLFERVKKLYDRRSDFVHQNADQEQITFTDEFELKSIVRQTFMKLLELRQQGFETVKKDNRYCLLYTSSHSLVDIFNKVLHRVSYDRDNINITAKLCQSLRRYLRVPAADHIRAKECHPLLSVLRCHQHPDSHLLARNTQLIHPELGSVEIEKSRSY